RAAARCHRGCYGGAGWLRVLGRRCVRREPGRKRRRSGNVAMRRAALLALLVALGCCTTRGHQESPSAREPAVTDDASRAARETAAPPDAPAHAPSAPPEGASAPAVPPPRLPDGVLVGVAMDVAVPGDSAVRVVHGGAEVRRALVYLHGMCGNPEAMADWHRVAIRNG